MIKYIDSLEEYLGQSKAREAAREKAIDYLNSIGICFDELPLPHINDGDVVLALARQVQTYDVEHAIIDNLAEINGIKRIDLSLGADHYVSNNIHKSSRVNTKVLNGKSITGEVIARPSNGDILREIMTNKGATLTDYHHRDLAKKADAELFDVSGLYSNALAQLLSSGQNQDTIWVLENGKSKKYSWIGSKGKYTNNGNEISSDEMIDLAYRDKVRPDASKYYQMMYLLQPGILNPAMILADTPWEHDCKKIYSAANDAYMFAEKVAGIPPATVQICNIDSLKKTKDVFIAKHPSQMILDEVPKIEPKGISGNFYDDSVNIEEAVLQYVKSRREA